MTDTTPGPSPTSPLHEAGPSSADVGYGAEPTADDRNWQAASDALTPDQSLTHINATARTTVSTVALVGTALTALGLLSASSLLAETVTRWLATAAAALALLAVVASITFLALRLERVRTGDLLDVEQWYRRQFRRAYIAVVGSWLLLAGVICAGAAAGTALWHRSHTNG